MSILTSMESGKMRPAMLLLLLTVVVVAGGAAYLLPRFEQEAPRIALVSDSGLLGRTPLEIVIADRGAGLRSVSATLQVGGAEQPIASEQYASPVPEKTIAVDLSRLSGVKDGAAVLHVVARDASLWNLFRGNDAALERRLTIDLTPPVVELIADDRYVNFGGVGAIVYRLSEDTVTSGVKIGDHFYPGYLGQVKGHPDRILALFAHSYDVPADAKATLVATDKAGNSREMPLAYELKNVKYKKSTIALSDAFLQGKVMPLSRGVTSQASVKEVFVAVNHDLRKENDDKIAAITRTGTPSILWKGAFTQLSNSKVEANFADERTYTFRGDPIDTAFHLGYDLSVTKHYPVEASNSGNVVFADDLGIYGNCVILDHGLGVFTLYSHLSSIDVKQGDSVTQRQILGKTGQTGLAAGDHLHFGIYLNGVAVLPVEWWDAKWIADNIEPKLGGQSGEAEAEMQAPKGLRKVPQKRGR